MLTGWRVADPSHSQTTEDMLSGEGAYLWGGRWNSKGTRVVYLASNLSLAAMELLVHLGRADVIKKYNKLGVSFEEDQAMHIDEDDLPKDWKDSTMESSVQNIGDQWIQDQSSLILQVPSIVVPGESNFLLNPEHSEFDDLIVGDICEFSYDSRVIK